MPALRMLQWPAEAEAFLAFVGQEKVRHVLEIGTGPGGFTKRLAQATGGDIVSVDLPASGDVTGLSLADCQARNIQLMQECPGFVGVLADSHAIDTVWRVAALLPQGVDLLFLDGDDSIDGKQDDFVKYARFVRPGGLIATHDIASYGRCGVPTWWAALKQLRHDGGVYEFVEPGHAWGGIGVFRA